MDLPSPFQTLDDFVTGWLSENAQRDAPVNPCPATEAEIALRHPKDCEFLWAFIKAATERATTTWQLTMLAAGPLEDLIVVRGDQFIDEIEELARTSPRFAYVLTGVWPQGRTETEVWNRIRAAREAMMSKGIDSRFDPPPL